MMLALKSGPQIAAKVANPAVITVPGIWYSVGKLGARDNGIPPRSTPDTHRIIDTIHKPNLWYHLLDIEHEK